MRSSYNHPGTIYEIQVQGELDRDWQQWLPGLTMTVTYTSARSPITTLSGSVVDQAALRGMLCKLWDLNLTLISVRRVGTERKEKCENE